MTIATKSLSNEIFIVHGHDETAKSQVALLIERAGLKPIILHEQGNGGKTIIEKFEKYGSAVGFAVVIASPDDVGGLAVSPPGEPDLKPRARQNVVGEMFWFAGRLCSCEREHRHAVRFLRVLFTLQWTTMAVGRANCCRS